MSLAIAELQRIVQLGAPVLCLDTCSLLDVMRDPTRIGPGSFWASDAQAAMDLLQAAESKTQMIALWADQVALEFHANVQGVEDEAKSGLIKHREQVRRIDAISTTFGATVRSNTLHLNDLVPRARAIVDRWVAASTALPQGSDVLSKACARVLAAIAPASRGKDSTKDCVVIETYLEGVAALRTAGLTAKIVFASSNVKDYCDGSRRLRSDIVQEFSALNLEFAPKLGAAKHSLGL